MNEPVCAVEDCGRGGRLTRGYCATHYARWLRRGTIELLTPWDRFWKKVDTKGICWEWIGADKGRGSYGHLQINGRMVQAHRQAWEFLVGPIPEGLELDHLCRNGACVNPDHLEPVTRRVNNLRSNSLSARRARQTACVKGHLFTAENTAVDALGRRYCRECTRARDRRRVRVWTPERIEARRAAERRRYWAKKESAA